MIKPIQDWKSILLDTSVIIDYILDPDRINNNDQWKKNIINTHKLFKYFEDTFTTDSRRQLYISAITVSELRKLPDGLNVFDFLSQLFNCSEIIFIDYTAEMAVEIHNYISLPNDVNINAHLSKLRKNLAQSGVYHASGWVSDDLKIASSAKFLKPKIDVVLTNDAKTFLPIAALFNIPIICVSDLPTDLLGDIDFTIPL